MKVSNKLDIIKKNIEKACQVSDRPPEDVKIVAVTKYVSEKRALEAVKSGLYHLGENRPDGLINKQEAINDKRVSWHFIGSLQSRKVKDVIPHIDFLHSLDRMSLAEEVNKRAEGRIVKCFIQVNISGEESKHGLPEEELMSFIKSLKSLEQIQIVGLMTMAPHTHNEKIIRQTFRRLKTWQTHISEQGLNHAPCQELSMGMSNDYGLAVEEGATFVRIGSALVGNDQ